MKIPLATDNIARLSALAAICLAAAACAHLPSIDPNYVLTDPTSAPICSINNRTDALTGKTATLEGIYFSDGSVYEYLKDKRCHDAFGQIDIGRRGQDPSVASFYKAKRALCAKRNSPLLCNVEAHVVVEVTVRLSAGGHLSDGQELPVADLNRVVSFEFAGNER